MAPVISVNQISKHYGSNETLVNALEDVNFSLQQGEFTATVGPSGSGKSTLLQLIGGLDKPQSGEIKLSGRELSQMSYKELSNFRRDHIGFVFQAYNLIPVLTVEENIEYILLLKGVEKEERQQRIYQILKRINMEDKIKKKPTELSGGQQQRVAIARALVAKPDIILADEPTANLDSKTGMEIIDLMKELNEQENITFLFSTHDPMIMSKAKRILHLKDGKITQDESR